MSDWTQSTELVMPATLGPGHEDALACETLLIGTPASTAMGTTNVALFFPFVVNSLQSNRFFWWLNGGVVSGNVDCGVYDSQGNLLDHCGPTAQAGTTALQSVPGIAPFGLRPAVYFVGLAWTSATATFLAGASPVTGFTQAHGWRTLTGLTAGTLPASAAAWTPSAVTQLPIFGVTSTGFR